MFDGPLKAKLELKLFHSLVIIMSFTLLTLLILIINFANLYIF